MIMLNQIIDQLISCLQIDSLTGLGVVKVECGSQFSVALTKSGAVYTWYAQWGTENIRSPKAICITVKC